jgi:hypothetical protein
MASPIVVQTCCDCNTTIPSGKSIHFCPAAPTSVPFRCDYDGRFIDYAASYVHGADLLADYVADLAADGLIVLPLAAVSEVAA